MSKANAKFTPKAKEQKRINQITSSDQFSSLSQDTYKRTLSTMSRLLNPETGSNESICTAFDTGRPTTVFKPKIVADLKVQQGLFKIVAFPRFRNPIAMTNEEQKASQSVVGARSFSSFPAVPSQRLVPNGKPTPTPVSFILSSAFSALPAMTLEGRDVPGCYLPRFDNGWTYSQAVLGASDTLSVSFESGQSIELRLSATNSGGVTTGVDTTLVNSNGYWQAAIPFPPDTQQFRLLARNTVDYAIVHSITLQITRQNAVVDREFLHYYNSEISRTVEDAADGFITLGMSAWIQYTGSTLVNGGEISGYRYPSNNLARWNSLNTTYQEVSSTPGALVGQLKDGAYGFYIPQGPQEMTFQPLETHSDLGYLCFVGRKTEADSSLRINFNQFLLVSTTNQAFSKTLLPADSEAFLAALSLLREADPVIKNDGHQQKINKALGWFRKHEKQIKAGTMTAAKLAKIAAPVLGALIV